MRLLFLFCLLCAFHFSFGFSDTTKVKRKVYHTQYHQDLNGFSLDGRLDDTHWKNLNWGEGFMVYFPNNGDDPQRETLFKIFYDDNHVYFGFYCLDDPESVVARMSRRDRFPGDWVEVNIDSYYDKSTAFSFTISASGVKGDEFVTGNGNNWDTNWNPIWYASTAIVENGWTAEIKIPFSQLRFGNKKEHVWGFNVMRRDFKADERSTFQFIPQNQPGWVSNFAELKGIRGIKPKRQVEIQPYTVSKLTIQEVEPGNPFTDGKDWINSVGVDGKVGITTDLTMDFTINPDFGQVEADPSALNLDGFQIFFDERRPFFVENANLFSFEVSNAVTGGSFNNDNLFYSRRIGQRPRGSYNVPNGAFVSAPDFTSILGATKFSGKTKTGWSIGVMESLTAEESTKVSLNDHVNYTVTEPFTNYFASRLSKDFKQGASRIGGTLTAVNRRLDGTGLEDQFHHSAYSGGVDFYHTWKNREWELKGNMVFSHVGGTAEKIYNTQTAFEHYFQRPDADYLKVNPNATSLLGHGGSLSIANSGGADNISFQTGFTWRSPELELNDIGFLNTADEINHFFWAGYRTPKPVGIFRRISVNYNHNLRWTFGREHQYIAISPNFSANFKNFWSIQSGLNMELKDISSKALFGGPSLRRSKGIYNFWNISSDSRKDVRVSGNFGYFNAMGSDKGSLAVRNAGVSFFVQPSNAFSLTLNPSLFWQNRVLQNVDSYNYNGHTRYITGRIKQKTFSMSVRANYSITPNLSFEYWGQPFVTRGNYSEFKYITDPLAISYLDRFELYDDRQIIASEDGSILYLDENRDGTYDYSFGNPDFNFVQWRSNMVLRWEYVPGSELFLVWAQSTSNNADPMQSVYDSLTENLFDSSMRNNFLLKVTYRFVN